MSKSRNGGPLRILSIAGSSRRESYNRATLHVAVVLAPMGVPLETFELGMLTTRALTSRVSRLSRAAKAFMDVETESFEIAQ